MGLDFRPRSAEDAKQMNVDAYFDKPLVPAKLLAKVEELLAGRSGGAAPDSGAASQGGADQGGTAAADGA